MLIQYEKQNRGGKGTHDTLMFITDRGQLYWLKVYRIPEGSRTAKGKAVNL